MLYILQEQIERVIPMHLRRYSLRHTGITLNTRKKLGFIRCYI
jgi:hypothetical protein